MNHSAARDIPQHKISAAAALLGISVHTMRMYEREGLIIPFRKKSGQRIYSDRDIERLQCIRRAITEDKMSIEGIRRVLSLIPCWAIVRCTSNDRETCPAYNGHSQPCWMLRRKPDYCSERDCRECEVYNAYADCNAIKQGLKELIPNNSR